MRAASGLIAAGRPTAAAGRPAARAAACRRIVPGLLLAAAVGLSAHLAADLVFPYALAVGFEVPLAMLLGLVVVILGGAGAWALPGIRFSVKHVLALGIVLLGLRLNLQTVAVIGAEAFALVVGAICAACAFAVLAGRWLGVERRVAVLIGVGSSVCGNSAILAAAPVVRADDRQVSFAVATITIFGTLAVLAFPLVGHALDLDVLAFGLWSGAAVPDTAQTIASSAAYSTVGRDVATVVKLVRNVLMAPLVLLIAWAWSRYGDDGVVSAGTARRSARRAFPYFLLGFLALALVRSARLVDPETVADVDAVTRACFVVALAGLGLQTRLDHLRALGLRPFLLGLGTSGLLAVGTLAVILALGLGPTRTAVAGGTDPRAKGAWTPVCEQGAPPAFAGAFVGLAHEEAVDVGRPVACAELDAGTGDTVQRTTRGVVALHAGTGLVTFSDRRRTWSMRGRRLVESSGPESVSPAAARAPAGAVPGIGWGARVRRVRLTARVVATGIPGAGAVSPVGTFHPGSPIHDKRSFAAATRPGAVLDPTRLLVASTSNFGAPPARGDWARGSIVSVATDAPAPLRPPPAFASSGTQARALGGDVQMYSAQAPAFSNRWHNPAAETAAVPGVADPRGISINNAFGRPWVAGASSREGSGIGVESVLDPDGRPLADAPSDHAGGVFAGVRTNREPQRETGGLGAAAVGNAFLGASPDTSNRAVFAVATADGALAQVHVEEGVDGLAPPGTLAPLTAGGAQDDAARHRLRRVGMVFNWVPDRFLYVSDPGNDAVLQLRLDDDFELFRVAAARRLESRYLAQPVDLAPAVPEIASPAFSSNTTLAGGSDLYVANRGSGTIVRMRQDGRIRAVARVALPGAGVLTSGVLNGIAVSPDADRIWLTLDGRQGRRDGLSGSVIEIPAFGIPR